MREILTSGSVEGVTGNPDSYSDQEYSHGARFSITSTPS